MARVLDDHTTPMPLHTFLDPPDEEEDLELQRMDSHRHFEPLDYDTKPILAEESVSPDSPNPNNPAAGASKDISSAKLVPLTIALCLAAFCLALVSLFFFFLELLDEDVLVVGAMWCGAAHIRLFIPSFAPSRTPGPDSAVLLTSISILGRHYPSYCDSENYKRV